MSVNITMDEYEDLLNEETVKVGRLTFGVGTVLRRCDPLVFHIQYHTYCAAIEQEIDDDA